MYILHVETIYIELSQNSRKGTVYYNIYQSNHGFPCDTVDFVAFVSFTKY